MFEGKQYTVSLVIGEENVKNRTTVFYASDIFEGSEVHGSKNNIIESEAETEENSNEKVSTLNI